MEDKKVRFEINNAAAEKAELKIRSKLLRLAKRVIQSKHTKEETELKIRPKPLHLAKRVIHSKSADEEKS